MSNITDHFGFLPVEQEIEWDSGKAIPLVDISDRIKKILKKANEDGYIYPPVTSLYRAKSIEKNGRLLFSDEVEWERVPKTSRPALLYKMPVSHKIELYTTPIESDFRNGDGAFLMHFIGFLFGFRLQFEDWWHDGRIYMRGRHWAIVTITKIDKYMSTAYRSWRSWPKLERKRFTNLLYMISRIDSYEWDWERFTINYMVFDGCFELVRNLNGWRRGRHTERFNTLFSYFGIQNKEDDINEIMNLRNDLFHETLWEKGQPCAGGTAGYRQTDNLRRINERLITAIAGCETDFIQTPWWHIGQCFI